MPLREYDTTQRAGGFPRRMNTFLLHSRQVPGPLTEEIELEQTEKKKAQKAAKKQREKEQKEEKRKLELEVEEKKRFASLTDREKVRWCGQIQTF